MIEKRIPQPVERIGDVRPHDRRTDGRKQVRQIIQNPVRRHALELLVEKQRQQKG